jgi:hypothetical protein
VPTFSVQIFGIWSQRDCETYGHLVWRDFELNVAEMEIAGLNASEWGASELY